MGRLQVRSSRREASLSEYRSAPRGTPLHDYGRRHRAATSRAPPYEGAKDYFLVQDRIEDAEWLGRLVRITADAVAPPKKNRMKKG